MATIDIVTIIRASPEICFDLSRDLDLHLRSMHKSQERAVGGITAGLIGLNEEVEWEARHFGVKHRHRSRITAYERPHHFRDEMTKGRFTRFEHDHFFESYNGGTRMRDVIEFESPFGAVGKLVDWVFLTGYLRRLMHMRNEAVRMEAEKRS